MDIDRLIADAKQKVLALAVNYRPGSPLENLPAPGRSIAASIKSQLWNLQMGGFVTAYEQEIGGIIADVICGGDVPAGTPDLRGVPAAARAQGVPQALRQQKDRRADPGDAEKWQAATQLEITRGKVLAPGQTMRPTGEHVKMKTAYILAAYRTPGCRANKGGFKDMRPDDLAAAAIRGLVERTGIDPIED